MNEFDVIINFVLMVCWWSFLGVWICYVAKADVWKGWWTWSVFGGLEKVCLGGDLEGSFCLENNF